MTNNEILNRMTSYFITIHQTFTVGIPRIALRHWKIERLQYDKRVMEQLILID